MLFPAPPFFLPDFRFFRLTKDLHAQNLGMVSDKKERIGKGLFASATALCVGAVLAIFVFLIVRSIPAFGKIGGGNLLFGRYWSPDRLDIYGASLAVALYQLSGE